MTEWIRSSYSSNGYCVEVHHEDHRVLLRDSKYEERGEESPVIEFTPSGWRSFLFVAQEWDRDRPVTISGVVLSNQAYHGEDAICLIVDAHQHLHFTMQEWDAFVSGVYAGEFQPEAIAG